MKRLVILLAVVAVGGAALTTAHARGGAKRAICHRTASKKNPYVKLSVSAAQLRAHLKHAPDIYPVPAGGCPRTVLTATSGGSAFTIALTGEAEHPSGDPVATGTATVRLRAGQGQACFRIAVNNLPRAAAAHIHRGAAAASGPVVIPLRTPNASGRSSGCVAAPRPLVQAILRSPGSYYVNVHTTEFPAGAVRGQLTGTSTSSFGWIASLTLKGTTEPNASGTAVVRIRRDAGLVCFRLQVEHITLPATAAHIHRGASGVNGPVVVPFTAPGTTGSSDGCVAAAATLIEEIIANPAGFYVNVHTQEHPAGAIRAQLG